MKVKILPPKFNFSEIPKLKLILGGFLFLFSVFSIYSLLYLSRETFRILTITGNYDFAIYTDKEVGFYNLFFAYIALIFSQSILFNFLFNSPRKFLEKRYAKRITIINDNRALNSYFINWFSKLALLYAIMFGLAFRKAYYVFSFYPEYNYIFILIIIVLFLQSWVTIRLRFKKQSLKLMIFSAIIISICAFALSKVNLIDYKKINETIQQNCELYNFDLQLPQTNNYTKLENTSLIENIYIVVNSDNEPIIIMDNEIIGFRRLEEKIINAQSMRSEADCKKITFVLNIDKRVEMNFVNELKILMAYQHALKIAYAILPMNFEYNEKYYMNFSVVSYIPPAYKTLKQTGMYNPLHCPVATKPTSFFYDIETLSPIVIKKINSNQCICNDTVISINKIGDYISTYIEADDNYFLIIRINDEDKFSEYFSILIQIKNSIHEKRNDYSQLIFQKSFKDLSEGQQDQVKKKYSMRITEITSGMIDSDERLKEFLKQYE